MNSIIKARNLCKSYPMMGDVLRGVDITLYGGEFVAIMGPSGCGKSTMLHLLGLLHSPDAGSLTMLGVDVLSLDREEAGVFRRDNIGLVLQSNNLFSHTTVYENVEFPLIYKRVPRNQRCQMIENVLSVVHLNYKANAWSNSLSGGEQQRVAIARALINNPKILLADEPTGALDSNSSHSLMQNFREVCTKRNVGVVMVTHDHHMAEYCDRVYHLEHGLIKS
ncbi:ABC transporter ATP-binding protein [Desulfovibrio falkowii]|uniref:ABC transporter ATP-binding protein n=1 Tax=Desulfovibrio falkowii TaxID=3136602 RepID=A0ABQ0E7E6_9BACT